MAWSTRQLAELAGTSLRTVRHYHEVGLLPEPERRANGYKQYGVGHLARLLRVKRLAELGFSLDRIAGMADGEEHPAQALRDLDAELAATIERLQGVREELAVILADSVPADLPPGLAPAVAVAKYRESDRAFAVIMGRVLSPEAIDRYREVLEEYYGEPDATGFDSLPEDADEATRVRVAELLAPQLKQLKENHPGVSELRDDTPDGRELAASAVIAALRDLYNPAQLDVLIRAERINGAEG
ncbi:MerR family transcriptional regulator [Actinosynnema pretiosum subsp. pretiosum]|uniref:Transcriptional regulator, MerR family n=2 Tax=Actinosynnema TaxID=40566 RepID=C6WK14_ACTMD|nr:MerR family transcriptional regulator [Actinosynnema mirum]ACU38227.1 transcriptional regulator, MerR family [Actinosynnema mirum DSM 43827]AXX31738.1 Transcriptional regulator, MerR family [Actinosynnema pretiosum subsp. pretiosum]QUF04254.1 MerR family transcriptional regulator [Actinosynnema pretiosum subsp. pretiosum]